MQYFCRICIYLILALSFPATVAADQLTVSYFERPPYYLTTKTGEARGFLVEKTKKILQTADVDARFISLKPNKVIFILKHANLPHCSIGWFKRPEREVFAKFTKPIYQNRPLVILTTKQNKAKFKKYHTLAEIFADNSLIMARMSSFSYGSYVDHLMEEYSPASSFYSGSQAALLHAIDTGKVTYMLVAPEEVQQMIASVKRPPTSFVQISLDEIPHGNFRYLMCGHAVSDELIGKLNSAIDTLSSKAD